MSTTPAAPPHAHGRHEPGPSLPPAVPLTMDGSAVLHQMFRFRRADWNKLSGEKRAAFAEEAVQLFARMEQAPGGGSALFSQLGHKGDLLLVHFRESFEDVNEAELQIASLGLNEYLEPTTSYVSTVELGLYASSVQLYNKLSADGVEPGSPEWQNAEQEKLAEQKAAMKDRLHPAVPPHRYVCFYPMDKKRGERNNWYSESIEERARMMRDHGMIGRKYAGKVKQIISGSIGFDDWEWGVDLFADDPLVFKQLIYEMRFDEASALYALFGPFYLGIRIPSQELTAFLAGKRPAYGAPAGE